MLKSLALQVFQCLIESLTRDSTCDNTKNHKLLAIGPRIIDVAKLAHSFSYRTPISRAAAKLTPSRVKGARTSFDLQMNSYVGAEDKPENSPGSAAQEEAPLPGTLNPYHGGRIRTAVPSKLKGRTIGNQGNFSVLQMQVQKPEMTARDLAAKRTSERTAAAAKLASSQRYRYGSLR
ncbi:hypothetical protein FLAG1_01370 [Fusarium langsethiae]|uniref:Uncharacterized protein n=1 Tax=Fusarium langsethiae TaxID=179993 RepID=A0A0N0DHJ7_FUSLA|nr:hypothetical protein FLAG1_01370 [Fusarium langsethiae]GKT99277.1 unnamed protein product [Fusarium langsethiae]